MAAVDYFLKIAGIDGESAHAAHRGEIDLESWSWGEVNTGSPVGGGGAGKVQMNDFSFVMKLNKASPKLFLACAEGKHIKTAWLTAQRGDAKSGDYFLKYSFYDLLVSSFQSAAGPAELPLDQASFRFAKIEVEYKAQKPDGTFEPGTKAGWDLKTNKKI